MMKDNESGREKLWQSFTAAADITVLEALKKIDADKKGFLVIVDKDMAVLGTLTDGDIRRAFIAGRSIDSPVKDIYIRKFKSLLVTDGIYKATDMFKNESIKFIPVLDKAGRLANVITRKQLHAVLLQDIHADLSYDFLSLDESVVDYEIYHRPWGFYKTTVMNDYFQSKVICVNPKAELSLQAHKHREEHWIVAHGRGTVQLDDSVFEVHCGSTVFIPKGCRHRLKNTDEKESLIVTEVQIGDYFGEDDIIRYEDIYGRV